MIDFHTHILPEIDDGAENIEESIAMLKMCKQQAVEVVALTPHYIASEESPEEFLQNRQLSYQKLTDALSELGESVPRTMLGAEVYYYPGILKMEQLNTLTLGNTNILLLEMPMAKWSEYTIREITEFAMCSDIQIVLAHIERYIKFNKIKTVERLLDSGVLMQSNASFFVNKKTRKKALKMFDNGYIHFIGSDCHNLEHRPPNLSPATDVLNEKFSKEAVEHFFKEQREYLLI